MEWSPLSLSPLDSYCIFLVFLLYPSVQTACDRVTYAPVCLPALTLDFQKADTMSFLYNAWIPWVVLRVSLKLERTSEIT